MISTDHLKLFPTSPFGASGEAAFRDLMNAGGLTLIESVDPDEELGFPLVLSFALDAWEARLTVIYEPPADLWWGHVEGVETAAAHTGLSADGSWLDTSEILDVVAESLRTGLHLRGVPFLIARAAPQAPSQPWLEVVSELLGADEPDVREAKVRGLIPGVAPLAQWTALRSELERIAEEDPCQEVQHAAQVALGRAEEPHFEVPARFEHLDTSDIDDAVVAQHRAVFRDQEIYAEDFAQVARDVGLVWDGSTHTADGFEARSEFWVDRNEQTTVAFVDDPIMGVAFLVVRGPKTPRVEKVLDACDIISADELLEAYQTDNKQEIKFGYLRQLICALEPRRTPDTALHLLIDLLDSADRDAAYAAIIALDYTLDDRLARAIRDRMSEEQRPGLRRLARDVLDRYLSELDQMRHLS